MSGPSVMVRVLGDLTGLGKSATDAGAKGSAAASGMHSAFSGMLSTLNSSGVLGPFGGALATADQALSNMGKHAKDSGAVMIGVGGAAMGLGMALSAAGSKDQASHQQLQAAIKATGKSYDDYGGKIEETIKKQERYGNTADQTQDALKTLTQATKDPAKALSLMGEASDLAATKHESLSEAATTLGKAYNGSGKALKEFGITMTTATDPAKELAKATKDSQKADDDLAKAKEHLLEVQTRDGDSKKLTASQALTLKEAQDKVTGASMTAAGAHEQLTKAQQDATKGAQGHQKELDELSKKLTGQASAGANTFTGRLKALKAATEDHIATLGQKYGPALTAAGAAMTGVGAAIEIARSASSALKLAQLAESVQTGIVTAATWLWNTALEANPLVLIVTLIALVVGAIIAIGIKFGWWKEIAHDLWGALTASFHGIKDAVEFVWDWIKDHWPLLLGMLFGPFGVAVSLIVTHWQQVVDFFRQVPGWIKGFFGDALHFLENVGHDIIQGMLNGLQAAWHLVTDWFNKAMNLIPGAVKKIMGIGSPSRVMHEQGMFIMEGLGLGLQAGFDQHVAGALDRTIGALSPGAAGSPYSAQTATTTAAAASSSSSASKSGAAITIEHAHFGDELDADAWLRTLAWRVRTAQL